MPPPPTSSHPDQPWFPFNSRGEFELADLLFRRNQAPQEHVDDLMHIIHMLNPDGRPPPFADHQDMNRHIDAITAGEAPWQSFSVRHSEADSGPDVNVAPWKVASYDVWYRDPRELLHRQLSNPDFVNNIDYSPRQVFGDKGQRVWTDFMTGNWAWNQCVHIQYL